MSARRRRTSVAPLTMLALLAAACAGAQPDARPTARRLSPDAHVRAVDDEARRVLETGLAASPTLARLVAALDDTDLIVAVQTAPMKRGMRGELKLLAAAGPVRYARVTLKTPNVLRELVAVLGHELQHAVEVAEASEVRDDVSFRRHYRQAGYQNGREGWYETEGAAAAGDRVSREITKAKLR